MCTSGKIKCTGTVSGFTTNAEYDIAQLVVIPDGTGGVFTAALVIDDNGDLSPTQNANGANFQIMELYIPKKVI